MTDEEKFEILRRLVDRSSGEQLVQGVAVALVAAQPYVTAYVTHGLTQEAVAEGLKETGNAFLRSLAKSHGIAVDKP